MPEPVALCVIGGGAIGQRHISCALASQAVALTSVVEPHAPQAARLAARGVTVVPELSAVPDHTRAAIVATPTANHAATALACLERGWAVLVEKPITASYAEAVALCDRAEALGLPLMAGHHRRCHPFVGAARMRLAALGDLVAVQGIWSLRKHDSYFDPAWRRSAGAGPVLTNLSHEIDLLHCIVGPITQVTAMTANAVRGFEVEDTAALAFRFANGALGSFVLSDAGASPWAFEAATGENPDIAVRGDDPVRLIGTKGAMGFPSLQSWAATGETPPDWHSPLDLCAGPSYPAVDGIAAQIDRFAAVVAGGTDPILATGRDGVRAIAVLDAVAASARSGRTTDVEGL
ncbi:MULTISPECIES: Gfo/Idh/MocA family protein [Roseobacteraceae]|uniref:4-carboxy-2-hydroxymuconate-6-semialdehyde dehydrogenase n=1 Tax=Pseudosulfitobacter pseudonitzschiae TaxID=1402135 RepID=A0A221JXD7_9RHOB|nr:MULTISPECIES: Gfo/Idh/MocA family oxidoreductase [Roseobacteraceae]ASM71384.1 4-carboxy-2-hydroxymuconate-6-semialdehyde dehydrogenase [Pseudosulfitobacter pseudonitzschiae]